MDSNESTDEKDGGPEVQINVPESVMSRIEELMGETELFDSAEFDAISYMNRLFPTEQSLCGVEAASARCGYRLAAAGEQLAAALRRRLQSQDGHKALVEARQAARELALQVAEINIRASRSESMVRSITSEMKQLDCAKSNLTAAITALNHLRMLRGAVDSLTQLTSKRSYAEVRPALQAIAQVLEHFSCYEDIPELSSLRARVLEARTALATQVYDDIHDAFTAGKQPRLSANTVFEACLVLELLEPSLKQKLVTFMVDTHLQEYRHVFSVEQECAWLSAVEQRYSWLKRLLLTLERRYATTLPYSYRLSERIAWEFCQLTHKDLSTIMTTRRSELDVKVLLFAIQKTTAFEALLHKRFNGLEENELNNGEKEENGEKKDTESTYEWLGAISSCFEPHLPIYVASLEASIKALIDRFIQESSESPPVPTGNTGSTGVVLSSCAELFLLYKKCLVQCAQLSNGEPMLQLCGVFSRQLSRYAREVVCPLTPRAPPLNPLQQLLAADIHRFTKQEIYRITSVITTSEYCLETCIHLEQKLKEKIKSELTEKVDLSHEQDMFHKMISDCIQMLIQEIENACDPALQAMTKISWLNLDAVGDQSYYVTQILMHLKNAIPILRDSLSTSRKYFTQLCIRFANCFIPKFIQNIYKCKPISTVGSEQLLLDTHMLKTALLELPSIGSEVKRQAPATYTKVVVKLMTKAEMILKLVMAPFESNLEVFAAQFIQLLPDGTVVDFHKVLEMKGVKLSKAQINSLHALFKDSSVSDRK